MGVISVSVGKRELEVLDRLVEEGSYRGRSDAVRSAIKALSLEQKQQRGIKGKMSGILILIHGEEDESAFSDARHKFEDLIKTLIHNQLKDKKCLEIFILEGDSVKVKELIRACRNSGRADYIKLIAT